MGFVFYSLLVQDFPFGELEGQPLDAAQNEEAYNNLFDHCRDSQEDY